MVDQKIEKEISDVGTHGIENALTALWEKAREASYLISTLRDEKRKLQTKINELEEELKQTKNELLLIQSRTLQADAMSNNGSSVRLGEEEKLELQKKIKSIIGKLDQYLST